MIFTGEQPARPGCRGGVLLCLALVSACLSLPGCASSRPDFYTIAFAHKGLGVGPSPNTSYLVLPAGQELAALRRAITLALQKREASAGDSKESEKEVDSDTVPLSQTDIDRYNEASGQAGKPQFRLPNDRQYGVAYKIEYSVNRTDLELKISALLKNRGAGNSEWRQLSAGRDYDSTYFTRPLHEDIKAALIDASKLETGTP